MSEKLTTRNQKISELFTDGEKLKSFYRFAAQNPHINLRDACQILILRPNATVCFSYEEWGAVGRKVKRGSRGIMYFDYDGNKQFVYDASDTRGENRAFRPMIPIENLFIGLDELNETDFADRKGSEYDKIQNGVRFYLHEHSELTGDEERDRLTAEGIYIQAEFLAQEIEDAYQSKREEVEVINDTEEETVSDEPVIRRTEEKTEREWEESEETAVTEETEPSEPVPAAPKEEIEIPDSVTPFYRQYLEAQKLNPRAVVLLRCGDFYEIMGENAKVVSAELDLTLTGRNVGLPERIPMCGMPYHAMDKYLDKILENHSVILADGESEPKILSQAEAQEGQRPTPVTEGVMDDEPNPFDDPQEEENDWRKELADELSDTDNDTEEELGEDGDDEEDIEGEEEPKTAKPAPRKSETGIKDRKRKTKPLLTLFDIGKPQEESREDKLINHELKSGSHVADGKIRIYDKYQENPTITAFADFLKHEYGIGGYYADNVGENHDAKGIELKYTEKDRPENHISVQMKWNEVAVRIAELIEDDDYLTEEEKQEYARVVRFREARESATTDDERCKVIADQIVEYGTQKSYGETFREYPHFLENYTQYYFDHQDEINERLLKRKEVVEVKKADDVLFREVNVSFHIKYCPHWQESLRRALRREHRVQDFANGFIESCAESESGTGESNIEWIISPEEIGEKDYLFIKDNRDEFVEYLQKKNGVKRAEFSMQKITIVFDRDYINGIKNGSIMPPSEQSRLIRGIAEKIVKEGTENTFEGNWITLYEDLKDKEDFAREHAEEIAVELEANQEVSDVILTLDGIDTNFYTDYCPNHEDDEDERDIEEPETQKNRLGFNRFKELTAAEQAFLNDYNKRHPKAPRQSPWGEVLQCNAITKGVYAVSVPYNGGIMISAELAPHILSTEALKYGLQENGYYCFEEDSDNVIPLRELYDKGILKNTNAYFTTRRVRATNPENGFIPFAEANEDEKAAFYESWNGVINRALGMWYPEYWKARQQAEAAVEKESSNTELTGILDQSELGGAKTRFRNNVAAIRLVNKLYAEKRNPTEEERKVLAQFVGWGGLSQAFDETNASWKKEYTELKALLSQEDYEQARSSTLNAFYTPKEVIDGIYGALARFGVKGNNRILEPAMGTGNFFGFMPKEVKEGARLYGVELDNLTGRIAAKMYPQANVQIKGFEDTTFPNDKFDVVVGNVPFGGYGVADSDYNRYNFKVHDYFLAKSVDKVKPNGIVAIVTSKGTMDKINPSARKYVAERAELLGAIRLPNTAFKQTAGTEAVADILFFRKRTERINLAEENIDWLGIYKTAEGYEINNYFADHPEMILGTLAEETGLYGGKDVTVKPDGRELSEAIREAVQNLPQGFYLNPEEPPDAERVTEVDYSVKPMCYKAENSRLYMRVGEEMVEQKIPSFPKDAYQRIKGMIALRDELHHILDIQIQGCSDEVLREEQRKLNLQYDIFVRRYGNVNGNTNARLFKEDGDSALLFACEEVNDETQTISKADIFTKRTIRPYVVPTSTNDSFEALQISKNERGYVDLSYIEELTGKDYETVVSELGNAVYRDPDLIDDGDIRSGFVTSEEYLSGQVVRKLATAQRYAAEHPEYQRNVEALQSVQPEPITASEISVRLGQTWVGKEVYKQFYLELIDAYWYMKSDVELYYNPHDSSWRIDQKDSVRRDTRMKQTEIYGTKRAPAYRLFLDCLNGRDTSIFDTIEEDGKPKSVLNQAETIAAREKQNKIRAEFQNWIFADPERREGLERKYNAIFNQTRLPSYDGSYLKFPEMNPAIELNPHQKNAVHRIITTDGSTLLHHVVGSGKTYTIIASVMKMRQLGLCKKAMVTVPNHLVEQWAGEWRKLYPNANILVATKEDLEKDNRRRFVSKVALGDWDGIVIAQSAFAKIPISKARQLEKINEEIASIELTLESRKKDKMSGGSIKNLERIKKNKQKQLKALMDGHKKDDVLIFENLGVDYLYVDEAHYYKNLFLFTKMNNVAGISNAASQRASDLKLKCEYLQELHDSDRGIVFATGTPISNSMTEMYTMQTYLQPQELKNSGITFFDGWAADFGETVTSMELSPSGQGYRTRTRFSKFTNLPELQKMYRSFADVITSDMVKLDVPEAEKKVITLKPSETVIELAEEIAERADKIYEGGVDPHEDNMLKVTSDGKKLALDPRCLNPNAQDEGGGKLSVAAENIYGIWESAGAERLTQIVFCDLSTPKMKFAEYRHGVDFDAYNELKYKLVQKGIPEEEIAYIHDASTDEQKQALFDKVNSGAVRILIGSTEKCGAGTNVQKKLVALHHLDTPYRPSDMEQREGRIIRQGNANQKVQIFTYVMERTFDSYSYQILENKQRFISQICKGDFTAREYEDVDTTTMSYAEIKAITAANPRIKRKMEVDAEISRLRILEGQYKKNLFYLQDKIRKDYPEEIRKQELLIERVTADIAHYAVHRPPADIFQINVNGVLYTDKKEGGKALMDAVLTGKLYTTIADYCGFKISIDARSVIVGDEREIMVTGSGNYGLSLGDSASGNITRIDNLFEDFPARKERLEQKLAQMKSDLGTAKGQVEKPFEHAERLSELLKEQAELNAELNLDKKEQVIFDDGNGGDEDNYMALPIQEKTITEVNIIEDQERTEEIIDYEREVKESVAEEYDEFKSEMASRAGDEVFRESYRINAYNSFSSVIEEMEEYFSDADYRALYEERGHILGNLYDEFLKSDGYPVDDYDETVEFIKDYCKHFHGEFYSGKEPIYFQTSKYAYEHNEIEEYRKSHKISEECRREIDEAIRAGYDGMHLNKGFEDGLIKKYGMERIAYVLATTVKEHEYDGRYGSENKEWARTVPISESIDERRNCYLNVHPAVLDEFVSRIRKKQKENQNKEIKEEQKTMAEEKEEKYLRVTPQGHKVLSMIKDSYDRNIAILQREEIGDYVVAARYDPKDGKWAQGTYDFTTVEEAEQYRAEHYGKETAAVIEDVKPARNWLHVHVSRDALIARHEFSSFFRMPNTGEYAGYGYSIYNDRFKNSSQLVDLQSDTRELSYDIRIAEDNTVKISHANGDEKTLTAREFLDLVSGTTAKDYEEKPRIEVNIPAEAKGNIYDNSIMFVLPNSVSDEKYTYFIPSRFVKDGEGENEGRIILSVPEDFIVKAKNIDGDEIEYPMPAFRDMCDGTIADDYYFESDEESEEDNARWYYVSVNKAARIAQYDNSSLFKMPKGEYEGYTYYVPGGFVKEEEEKDTVRIGLPEDFVMKIKDRKTGDEVSMSAEEFTEQVRNKKTAAYRYFQKPSEEAKEQFAEREKLLQRNVPSEMRERENWVAIATFEKEDGKIGKRPINCKTGQYASDADPETWTDFDTACKFARENGCTTIAYALDGKDGIACIDLDHCIEENGDYTELASKTFKLSDGTYCERSVSGKGLHIFGKTSGADLRSFSKDGDMEFYREARFIAVTGDYFGSNALKSLDTAPMKELLESKFAKRAPVTNAGRGIEGLAQMNDREVYDKACSAYNGEKFKALYEGQDLKNDHSRSDMALMSSLAFWCNGDKEQMLRIFASSGLYRRGKSQNYYECTALKAIETIGERYTPKSKTEQKKPASGKHADGNGKR